MNRGIEVSGMGCICSIGNSVEEFLAKVRAQRIGEKESNDMNIKEVNLHFQNEKIEKAMPRLDRTCKMLLLAVEEALMGLDIETLRKKRVGIIIGSAYGVSRAQEMYFTKYLRIGKGLPTYFQATTQNLLSGIIAYEYELKGLNFTVIDGWTSGLDAITLGMMYIQNDVVDVMIAGGVDGICSSIQSYHEEMLAKGKLLDSFCQGEGAGVVVLEACCHEEKEDRQIYVEQGCFYGKEDLMQELQKCLRRYNGIETCYLNANHTIFDTVEQEIIKEINPGKCIRIKDYIGECGAASGVLQLIHAKAASSKQNLILQISCQGKYAFCLV